MLDGLTGKRILFNIDEGCDEEYPEFKEELIPPFDKHFERVFMPILNDAAEIYASHIPEKGDSWLRDTVDMQLSRVVHKTGDFLALLCGSHYSPPAIRKELLDVINQSLMAVYLLDEENQNETENEAQPETPE